MRPSLEVGVGDTRFVVDAGADGEIDDGSGHDDLTGVRDTLHTRSEVDCEAADVVGSAFDLPGVQPCPQLQAETASVVA
jgi:hypothetical protein